jgi:uncharacterized membrane protein
MKTFFIFAVGVVVSFIAGWFMRGRLINSQVNQIDVQLKSNQAKMKAAIVASTPKPNVR